MSEASAYVRNLPIGERIDFSAVGVEGWEGLPWYDDAPVRPLEPPVLPEPPRPGEFGSDDCGLCQRPDENLIWADDEWTVRHTGAPTGAPVLITVSPRYHADFAGLPEGLSRSSGPILQRVERAVLALPGIGRVHIYKWGDGGAHLRYFVLARPTGMQQMRGVFMALWDDILPPISVSDWKATLTSIADELAVGGGTSCR